MMYFMLFLGLCFVLGGLAVASNPSPYYGVVGLVLSSIVGCGWLMSLGLSFVALVLFMVYLGGDVSGFCLFCFFSSGSVSETWGDWRVVGYGLGFVLVLVLGVVMGGPVTAWKLGVGTVHGVEMFFVRMNFGGAVLFYSWGVGLFLVAGWGLLLTLFVVLELVRGLSRGAIRAV